MQFQISVIVPVYKVEKYLEKCLDSLVCQTYKNIEIIVVDDGSPDNCPQICDEYAQKYDFITAYHKKNSGLSSARNYGVKCSSGEWIAFVDSDDFVEPTYVEHLWKLQQQFQADMVVERVVRENEDGSGRPAPLIGFEPYCADSKTAIYEIYKAEKVGWSAYGKLIKRSVLLKHPFPDGYYEDCACMYFLIDECKKIAIGNFETDYHYISRNGSILKNKLKEEHYRIFDICDEFEQYIYKYHQDLNVLPVLFYRLAVTQMLNCQTMSWCCYKEIYMKYRPLFRNNLKRVFCDTSLSSKQKWFMLMHCLTPEIFKLQSIIVKTARTVVFELFRKSG